MIGWILWLLGKDDGVEKCHSCGDILGEDWSSVILAHEDEWGHDTESEYKMCGRCSEVFEQYRLHRQGGKDDTL